MRTLIVLVAIIPILSAFTFEPDSYFIRFWNGNIPLSDKEREAWNTCVDEAELKFPLKIDPLGKERLRYEKECLNKKGY